MPHFLKSKTVKAILIILGGIAVLFIAFGSGIALGYHKAMFASRWGENYADNFYGSSTGPPPPGFSGTTMDPSPWNAHGVAGMIIDLATGTISVRDPENNERSVVIVPETLIRTDRGTITASGLSVGDQITAIGEPNGQGQLSARFIRVVVTP